MTGGDDHTAVRVRIHGRVQGVWYRAWTAQTARGLGLSGWVRNRRDGTVEAVFAGPASAVEEMITACRDGPPAARVEAIDRQPEQEPVPPGFYQRPTV